MGAACEAFDAVGKAGAHNVTFVSCEPLSEPVKIASVGAPIDWVIIGGRSASTGAPAMQPEWAWVEALTTSARLVGAAVYWKPNLTVRPREYPEAHTP